jgi:phenylacetic acid degradation protein paaN
MVMDGLFRRHQTLVDAALAAQAARGFWAPFSEIPSGKTYGETAKDDGLAAFEALRDKPFVLPGHPEAGYVGCEVSPHGPALGITYPSAPIEALVAAAKTSAPQWAAVTPAQRTGLCVEMVVRLNRLSFMMAHAVMHTTGQAFAMAFQAGGPHAQDRALEAIVTAYADMARTPASAIWTKPQGKAAPIILEKHWRIIPRGIGLVIGCQTFPTWNSYPGLFASLVTGNPVIVKPHPAAILPLALTVSVMRDVLAEYGLPRDVVLLAVDQAGQEITKRLVQHPDIAIIDYTGSNAFGSWVKAHAPHAQIYTEEAGVNTMILAATDDFVGMCANIAFSLSLYSGQMCTAPQTLFIPAGGIETDQGHKSFDEIGRALAAAIDDLLSDPARASGICGAIANPATLDRLKVLRERWLHEGGTIVRESAALAAGRTATPLLLAAACEQTELYQDEWFGPMAFLVAVKDADAGIARAACLAQRKGAITAALYDRDEQRINHAIEAFCRAGVNLSINLTGSIYVNQSAAFSDYHVTGANPAGNASLTDTAFVANRYRVAMWRRPVTV